ncbi:unnamed protein product, partial [Prorocentrum cordatum]
VAAGGRHTVLLRSDGTAVACGYNDEGQCDIPALVGDVTYTQVAAGGRHTVLLRSDGTAMACGYNDEGQCDIPALVRDVTYSQVAAGAGHTVLLRSDGTAVACRHFDEGQHDLPAMVGGVTYSQVAAGGDHTVLLRSDGTAVACGWNDHGQCDIPALVGDVVYVAHLLPTLLLQARLEGGSVCFVTLGGAERCRVPWAGPAARLEDVYGQLTEARRAGRMGTGAWGVDAVLPDGRLISRASAEETVASAFGAG